MTVRRVLLPAPRGFCAGVEMAIKALSWMVRVFEPPVYCYHQIVHNQAVIDRFAALGVIFVDDVGEVPDGAPLMLSAHGTAPGVAEEARQAGRVVVDAVCPLVTKVHHELKVRAARGYTVLYVGHAGHEEAVGTMAVAPGAVHLVQTVDDVGRLREPAGPLALLSQTTLARHEWLSIKQAAAERFGEVWMPGREDLCFATTNRQAALAEIAAVSDAVIVIGSANSSNTVSLERAAAVGGCSRVHRVDGPSELPGDLSGTVAVTAGASAPEEIVQAVVDALAPTDGVEMVNVVDEDEYFPPPRELRDLVRAVAILASAGVGGQPPAASPLAEDRSVPASDVLVQMASLASSKR
ncbi:MAG: 4-hydroxy-3-methylbut-2-enyl diphosphate reductase [Acidimicrobiales bacterium]